MAIISVYSYIDTILSHSHFCDKKIEIKRDRLARSLQYGNSSAQPGIKIPRDKLTNPVIRSLAQGAMNQSPWNLETRVLHAAKGS